MLDINIIKKIEDFVSEKPRSVQEISFLLKKNWRTADRYIDYIKENFGTISSRTFRDGTRGALKVVFWSNINENKGTVFQKNLQKSVRILHYKNQPCK